MFFFVAGGFLGMGTGENIGLSLDSGLRRGVAADVRGALREDLGAGDLSAALAGGERRRGVLFCRQGAALCGVPWFEGVFLALDKSAEFEWRVCEGGALRKTKEPVCVVSASAAALLSGERAALNFLQTLSATATAARKWQKRAAPAVLTDTRKTLPKLRAAQKYAVRIGGARNHRLGLFDEILIKENHIAAAGGIKAALQKAFAICGGKKRVMIETRDLGELRLALKAGAARILLDNFSLPQLREAVRICGGRAELEASGGILFSSLPQIAATGVDRISAGAITKNIRAVDFSFVLES